MPDPSSLQTGPALLRQNARPGELAGMARYGIVGENCLGLSVPAMRSITLRALDCGGCAAGAGE